MADGAESRILVVRADRIGDVVLSTPVIEALRVAKPQASLSLLVRANVAPLLRGLPGVSEIIVYEPQGRHSGWRGFLKLVAEIRAARISTAVVLQAPFRIALAIFAAGVVRRVGPLSKPWSWLLFNDGMRQRRSSVEMHEADYNLQLLRKLGIQVGSREIRTRIQVNPQVREAAQAWLRGAGARPEGLIGVHPGMGGSALNWPEEHYAGLIRSLLREGRQVLVTGGALDRATISKVRKELGDDAASAIWFEAQPSQGVEFLAALYQSCAVVVAPSTGPLHLAVAVGTPVVTFYPPIRVQSPARWGPYLPEGDRSSVLVPQVPCAEEFSCRGPRCRYYPCMNSISVDQALHEVHRQLGAR